MGEQRGGQPGYNVYQQQAKRVKPFYEAILAGLVRQPQMDGAGQQGAQARYNEEMQRRQ
jgi:hypothetical protein